VHMRNTWKRVALVAMAIVAVATVTAGCGSSGSTGSSSAAEPSSSGSSGLAGSSAGSGTSSSGGIADAQAQVKEFTANPALVVSPLPSAPASSTYAIQVNCTIPSCAPGAMKPVMDVLGWRFEEIPFDLAKGPADVQRALAAAIAAKPDVILITPVFPEDSFQSQIESGVSEGIKFVQISGTARPAYTACIQCEDSLHALGALAANIALADAGGKTDIAVAFDPNISALQAEADGIKAEVAKNGDGSQVMEIEQKVSAPPADNAARIVSFLQRNPSVKYLLVTSQLQPATALNNAGLGSQVKIVGMYPQNEADVAAVKDGQVLAYAAGEFHSLYWRAVDAAARAAEGVEVDPFAPIQSLRVIDQSNADISLVDPSNYEDIYKTAWQK